MDVQRVHTRTWLIIMIFCAISGWGATQWTEIEDCMSVGMAGSGLALIFYLVSRRTQLTVSLEDGSELKVAVRNKHFVGASRFANIVCRVCTLWEPTRDRETTPADIPMHGRSRAAIEIVDDDDPPSEKQMRTDGNDAKSKDLAAQITGNDETDEHPRIMMPETPEPDDETTVNPLGVAKRETSA